MKYIRVLGMAAALAVATPQSVWAQAGGDTTALIQEFKGESAAQTRTAAQWQADYSKALDTLLPGIGSDDLNAQRDAQNTWERISLRAARPGADAERAALVQSMLGKVGPQSNQTARIWLLKMLELTGRAEAVPTLVNLLADADAEIGERARRALANNPSPEAAQALREQLNKATAPEKRIAFINALAYRRDAASIAAVGKFATDTNADVAAQAIAALGNIGNPEAGKVLSGLQAKVTPALRPQLIDTQLKVAGQLATGNRAKDAAALYAALYAPTEKANVRWAALRGLTLTQGTGALPRLVEALSGDNEKMRNAAAQYTLLLPPTATKALTTALPKLPATGQVALLDALAERGDVAARADVLALAKSTSDEVRVAAWRALGALGNSSDITVLANTAANAAGAEANNARESLARLRGADVDAALLKTLGTADAKTKVELVKALSARRAQAALPTFITLASDADGAVRSEAIGALGNVGGEIHIPAVLSFMQKTKDNGEISAGERALVNIYNRTARREGSAAPVLLMLSDANSSPALRASLLKVTGVVGGPTAYNTVKTSIQDKDATVQEAAVRALSDWSDPVAAPDVLEYARTTDNQKYNVLALRGLDRMLRQGGRSNEEKFKLYSEALNVAKRGEEKRLFIGGLGEIREPGALQLVQPFLDDEGLREEAAQSVVKIAKDWNGDRLKEARSALEKVVGFTKNNDLKRDAQNALNRIK